MNSIFLISMPGGTEWVFIGAVFALWIVGITKILQRETNQTSRIVFILISLFFPPFVIAYLVYAVFVPVKDKKIESDMV